MNALRGMSSRITGFFREDVWRGRLDRMNALRRMSYGVTRISLIAARRFIADKCPLWACTLTFYSLLSIVPVMAMAFGIAKGFNLDGILHRMIVSSQGWQGDVFNLIIRFATTYLERASSGVIAGAGVAVLLWSVVSMLSNIEDSLNMIWEVRRPRSLMRKFADYLSMMLIGTILLAAYGSLMVVIAGTMRGPAVAHSAFLSAASPFVSLLLRALPYIVVWMLFSFIYIFMPNRAIPPVPACAGALVGAILFQLVQRAYVMFQFGASSFGPVYGGFVALPLFLVWLQASWMVVLLGAETARAVTAVETYGYYPDYTRLSGALRRLLLLRVMHGIVQSYARGGPAMTVRMLADELEIPEVLVRRMIDTLADAGLVVANAGDSTYHPQCDIERFTITFVLNAVERMGEGAAHAGPEQAAGAFPAMAAQMQFEGSLAEFALLAERSPGNRRLKDIG